MRDIVRTTEHDQQRNSARVRQGVDSVNEHQSRGLASASDLFLPLLNRCFGQSVQIQALIPSKQVSPGARSAGGSNQPAELWESRVSCRHGSPSCGGCFHSCTCLGLLWESHDGWL